jgi:hypothetical protein
MNSNSALKDPVIVTIALIFSLMVFGVIGTLVVRPQHLPPQIRACEESIAHFME